MKQLLLLFVLTTFLNVSAQEFDVLKSTPRINDVILRTTMEQDLVSHLGQPDAAIKEEINAYGEEENLRVYYYGDSHFECWDGFVQSFLIKDSGYRYNDLFEVGDSVAILNECFPNSFANPVGERNINTYDRTVFDFDTYYWVNGGGGNGLIILVKENIIVGFRYSVGV